MKSQAISDVFPKRLMCAIERTGKPQSHISKDAGIAVGSMHNYVIGKRLPDLDVVAALANACETTVAYLVGESDDSSEQDGGAIHSCALDVRLPRILIALGNPSPEELAGRVGITQKRARELIQGKSKPTIQEVGLLLEEVTNVALVLSSHLPALSPDQRQQVNG